MSRTVSSACLALAAAGMLAIPLPAAAASLTVTRFNDPVPDGCAPADCSLREAIIAANATPAHDTVSLDPGVYTLSLPGTGEDAAADGDLDVTSPTTISGRGRGVTVLDAGGEATGERALDVDSAATISGLTVRNSTDVDRAGVSAREGSTLTLTDVAVTGHRSSPDGYGSGIVAQGVLEMTDVEVLGNVAGWGCCAGIYHISTSTTATFTATNLTVSGNSGPACCSGLFSDTGGEVRIDGIDLHDNASEFRCCTGMFIGGIGAVRVSRADVSGNDAPTCCAGIYLAPGAASRIEASAVHGNSSSLSCCVGISTLRDVVIENVTVSGNSAAECCAGIVHDAAGSRARVTGATVTANVADSDGTGSGDGGSGLVESAGELEAANTISAGNELGPGGARRDCSGSILSVGHNLFGSASDCGVVATGPGDLVGVDPLLGPLGDNGGPTPTHPLARRSPAIGAGSPGPPGGEAGACASTDQRGVPRNRCDIGAYELVRCRGVVVNRVGTAGADTLDGTSRRDGFLGFGGADKARGRGGSDSLCGGGGRDRLRGDGGRDRLVGGGGSDRLVGGRGADLCIGGPGRDRGRACERSRST